MSAFEKRAGWVLVTGGARRVGAEIVRGLARSGCRVLIHANRSLDSAEDLAAEIRGMGAEAGVVQADLGVDDGITKLAGCIGGDGGYDVRAVVHGASAYERIRLEDLQPSDLDRYYRVHQKTPLFLAQALRLHLRRIGESGRMIFITDAGLRRPYSGFSAYFTTKAGLDGLMRALAMEMVPEVRVNAVAPGTVLPPESCSSEFAAALAKQSPLGRVGEPADVVRAVLFLLDDPGFMTGATIQVDGGAFL